MDFHLTMERDPALNKFLEKEKECFQETQGGFNDQGAHRIEENKVQDDNTCQQQDEKDIQCLNTEVTYDLTKYAAAPDTKQLPACQKVDETLASATNRTSAEPEHNDPQQSILVPAAATNDGTNSRASISLQTVASVGMIRNSMARAEHCRPQARRFHQESETMQQWRKDFEERLRIKDQLEAEAIKELREEAGRSKREWYAQWPAEVAERRVLRSLEEQMAADALRESNSNSTCWQRMSRIAKSLNIRRESKDLNRMRALLIALERPPKRTVPILNVSHVQFLASNDWCNNTTQGSS
ncbi:uncharacterized protein LOC111244734 isoform X3 [Varroa destructor]|uniref:Clathrin light chain n=1 Tax=Varroa destructor TaxID=109461 RepID=A0A7M7J7A2_VARDE|nr:uncharacterized protein LOC111244734 isoform X3 [Varroa destructor]